MNSVGDRSPMNAAILDGAFDQFARHGFAKSTMTDIADSAGVSRRALYNYFQTKEDVFKALTKRIQENVYAAVVEANASTTSPEERLLGVIHARSSWIYDLLHRSAFAREFIDEKDRISGEQARVASELYERLIGKILKEMQLPPARAKRAARILIRSVAGILEAAESRSEAETHVTELVASFTVGLQRS